MKLQKERLNQRLKIVSLNNICKNSDILYIHRARPHYLTA
jgi:hypothetical protein